MDYKHHFDNIKYIYGNANVKIPNEIFYKLSQNIRSENRGANVKQISFTYTYLITISFLYKYAHFVDLDNKSYIQNADIKEMLGKSRKTKTLDKIIKGGGILDNLNITRTTNNYPIRFYTNQEEKINNIPLREFITINDIDKNDINYGLVKQIVKNRNYEIKEPLFLTISFDDREYGTLYDVSRTHEITIDEFIMFIFDDQFDNIDFLIYGYIKSKSKCSKQNRLTKSVNNIINELGIDKVTFYSRTEKLKGLKIIDVTRKEWKVSKNNKSSPNDYTWIGI